MSAMPTKPTLIQALAQPGIVAAWKTASTPSVLHLAWVVMIPVNVVVLCVMGAMLAWRHLSPSI